jgi:hypothetical protein
MEEAGRALFEIQYGICLAADFNHRNYVTAAECDTIVQNTAAVLTGIPGWHVKLRSPLIKVASELRQSLAGTGADIFIRPLFKSSLKFSDHAHLYGQYWLSLPPLYSSNQCFQNWFYFHYLVTG